MTTAAGMLVYDASNGFCARRIDVLVPDTWDQSRILKESRKRLPRKMTLVEPVPESIMIYPADGDAYFSDWRDPQASLF